MLHQKVTGKFPTAEPVQCHGSQVAEIIRQRDAESEQTA